MHAKWIISIPLFAVSFSCTSTPDAVPELQYFGFGGNTPGLLTAEMPGDSLYQENNQAPGARWLAERAQARFKNLSHWLPRRPSWVTQGIPSQWLQLPQAEASEAWIDTILHCQFLTYDALGGFCDGFCHGQGLLREADRQWDEAFSLLSCGDTGCSPLGLEQGIQALQTAAGFYYSAAALMLPPTAESFGESTLAESCIEGYEDGIRQVAGGQGVPPPTSTAAERYNRKVIYAVKQFEAAATEAIRRVLSRADVGYPELSPTDGAYQEWYGDNAPRSRAIQMLLGPNLYQFPCSVDPKNERVAGALAVYELAGREPQIENLGANICELAENSGLKGRCACTPLGGECPPAPGPDQDALLDDIFSAHGTDSVGYELATRYIAERLRATNTAVDPDFPERSARPENSFEGVEKPFELWLLDGSLSLDPQTSRPSVGFPVAPSAANFFWEDRRPNGYYGRQTFSWAWFGSVPGFARQAGYLRAYWDAVTCGKLFDIYLPDSPGPDIYCTDNGKWEPIGRALTKIAGKPKSVTHRNRFWRSSDDFEIGLYSIGIPDLSEQPFLRDAMGQSGEFDYSKAETLLKAGLSMVPRGNAAAYLRPNGAPLGAATNPGCIAYEDTDVGFCSFREDMDPEFSAGMDREAKIPDYLPSLNESWNAPAPSHVRAEGGTGSRFGGWVFVFDGRIIGDYSHPTMPIRSWKPNKIGYGKSDYGPHPPEFFYYYEQEDLNTYKYRGKAINRNYSGGSLENLARVVLERHSHDCRKPAKNSLGFPTGYVPPLENELTHDPIPYESSYRRYLDLATVASADASTAALEAADAEHALKESELIYANEIEQSFHEASQGVIQLCGATAASLTEDSERVFEECSLDVMPLGPIDDGATYENDVRARWLKPYISGTLTPSVPVGNTTAELIESMKANCLSRPDYPADSPEIGPKVDALVFEVPCITFGVLLAEIANLEGQPIPIIVHDGVIDDGDKLPGGELRQQAGQVETQLDVIGTAFAVTVEQLRSIQNVLWKLKAKESALQASQAQGLFEIVNKAIDASIKAVGCGVAIYVGAVPAAIKACTIAAQSIADLGGSIAGQSALDIETQSLIFDLGMAIAGFNEGLQRSLLNIELAQDQIRGHMWEIDDIPGKVGLLVEGANLRNQRAEIESLSHDPWVRATVVTESRRAQKKMLRAKKLAFIARQAVEFKFVVDLERMDEPMLLGDVPSQWARDIFLEGYVAEEPSAGFLKPTQDFTTRLSDFVTFYSASFPFQNGSATAIISVKDDLGTPYFTCCQAGTDCPGDIAPPAGTPDPNFDKRPCSIQPNPNVPGESLAVAPYDFDGVLMRSRFSRHCEGDRREFFYDVQEDCQSGKNTDYFVRWFRFSFSDLSKNGRLAHIGLSDNNFNYRVRRIALNLVGSNVLDCTQSADPSNCAASAFVPYDLIQTGAIVMSDHSGSNQEYVLPRGGILSGKALASERYITSPIAAADFELLSQYWAKEFEGRPLQGEYEIRLYQTGAFVWEELTDIQLVIELDYWSPFETLP